MLPSVLFVTVAVLSLLPFLSAQFGSYTAAPRLWHTFDVEPAPIVFRPNTTSFTWSRGFQPHEGTVLLNGINDFIDLYLVPDDYGRTLPRQMPRSVSFEWWVKWNALNSYSRLLDCGNGPFSDNMYVSNVATSNDLRAAFYRGNSTAPVSQAINAPRAIYPNTWQHVVVTIRQKSRYDQNSNNSAEIDIYVDGRLFVRQNQATLPAMVNRVNCWIGKSEWKAANPASTDEYFYGWIDDFFWYDYPLGQEEVLAHFVLPRPPVYELTFSHDPRLIQNPNLNLNYTYRWTNVDDQDASNITKYHNGHLVLIGDSFIDLEAASGNASIGAAAMPIIGGANSGANGSLPMGWTIEVLFKPSTHEDWAKVFDIGDGVTADNLILGYNFNTSLMRFEVYNSLSANQSIHTVIPNTTLNRWYHVVLVLSPYPNTRISRLHIYVDGNLTSNVPYCNSPLPVRRSHAYIGKSNWDNAFMDMYLDTFRLYDYSLTATEVHQLYTVTHSELPNATTTGVISHVYHSAPVAAYTFSSRPTGLMVEGTNYRWDYDTRFKFPHQGVAMFNGVGEYINVATYPGNAAGAVLPQVGGSFSIECWIMFDSFRLYSRIIDLGSLSGYGSHNIILANQGRTNSLMFEVYSGTLATQVLVSNALEVGEWVHIVASVEQLMVNDTYSAQAGSLRLYINGVERASTLGFIPQPVPRPNGFIARSNWRGDEYFAGNLDALYFYDTALSAEQVQAHFLIPVPPMFELAFERDPRPWVQGVASMSQFNYVWRAFDPADFITNQTQTHSGHLELIGNAALNYDPWINLTATTGPHSVGTALTATLFGPGSGGRLDDGARYYGWTFEILVKIKKQEKGAKLFELGAGYGSASESFQDNVGIGYWDDRDVLNFYTYGGPDGKQGLAIAIIPKVELDTWYHIVIVIRPSSTPQKADVIAYVDGEASVTSNDYLYYPRAVPRPRCYLGSSPWVNGYDEFMDMYLDTFRIYDIGLTPDFVQRLYRVTVNNPAAAQEPLFHAGPLMSYTFDAPPNPLYLTGGTTFTWEQNAFPHTGLATFDGQNEWINLMTYPDDYGRPWPAVIGNQSFSIEAWARWDDLRQYSRIIDLANGGGADNILLGNKEQTGRLIFHTYVNDNGTARVGAAESSGFPLTPRAWHHVVATLDDLTKYPANRNLSPTGQESAWMTLYVDGALWAEGPGPRPKAVARTQAYMGKSHWVDDALFRGAIDSLYFYDFALSLEQVNVHRFTPRPPVFDLAFDSDPRWWLGGTAASYTYQWQDYDPTDAFANNTKSHSGHLVLTGASRETSYVNLSALTGYSSIGVGLPRIGGGQSVAAGGTEAGWSFEIVVKLSTVGKWAKLLDWGQNAAPGWNLDNIVIGYLDNSTTLEFRVWNGLKGNDMSTFVNITAVQLNRWYHIVVVVTPVGNPLDYNARYDAWVDGQRTNSNAEAYYPRAFKRNSALLGRTNWIYSDDAPFACKLDALRVYDYALPAYAVRQLYAVAHDPQIIPPMQISTAALRVPSSSSTGAPRASSSSARAVTSSARSSTVISSSARRQSSSSTSAKPVPCPYWARGTNQPNCRCPDLGRYPDFCQCPENEDEYYPYCSDNPVMSSSGSGAVSSSGPSSSLIAGVVVALIALAAIAVFVYYKYFGQQNKVSTQGGGVLGGPSSHTQGKGQTGGEDKLSTGLLGSTNGDSAADYHQHKETNGNGHSKETATGVEML